MKSNFYSQKLLNRRNMNSETKLITIKIVHTLIWTFFNVVIFYMLYAVIVNKLDKWLWIGYGLFALEGITLFLFKFFCPLTLMARKYSNSTKDNFDIFFTELVGEKYKAHLHFHFSVHYDLDRLSVIEINSATINWVWQIQLDHKAMKR